MIWSSFGKDGYAVGVSEVGDGEGHGGRGATTPSPCSAVTAATGCSSETSRAALNIVMHAPQLPRAGAERAVILPLEERDDMLYVKEVGVPYCK